MTKKRFNIVKSKMVKDGWVIEDKNKQFTFPILKGDKRGLIAYCKSLNTLAEENRDYREWYTDAKKEVNDLIRLCEEFNINWRNVIKNDV